MEYLTTGEVAQLLSVSEQTIRRWIDSGEMPGERPTLFSPRRVRRSDLIEWAKARNLHLDWSVLE
jgi:excisionase family DNA binding protein